MPTTTHYVMGATHIDLAWKVGESEMAEFLDVMVLRVLDLLDQSPDFTYVLEQAYHFRGLAARRPDLVARLKPHLASGRLEFVGGMASTLETNIPAGESLVRNQLIGLRWVESNLGVTPQTAWLIDTFGLNPQLPQILSQFGMRYLMANRLGGVQHHDAMAARGLDGTMLKIVGRDVYSSYVAPGVLAFEMAHGVERIDAAFEREATKPGPGPFLLVNCTENEMQISSRPIELVAQANAAGASGAWRFSTATEYLQALEASGFMWPEVDADLNPEFTGCFSQRMALRTTNRRAETALLEAGKWATLTNLPAATWREELENAWWALAFCQFHDVFTGSHPTSVFESALARLADVETYATRLRRTALGPRDAPDYPAAPTSLVGTYAVHNGLPWQRRGLVVLQAPAVAREDAAHGAATYRVSRVCGGNMREETACDVVGDSLVFAADAPPCGYQQYRVEVGVCSDAPEGSPEGTRLAGLAEAEYPYTRLLAGSRVPALIENEFIALECAAGEGLRRLTWKPTGRALLESVSDFLVVQPDRGSFQMEAPAGSEIPADAGTIELASSASSAVSSNIMLSGQFPVAADLGPGEPLAWEAEFTLVPGKPLVYVRLTLHWHGEASRVRLKVPTTVDTATGIYEVPFGVVRRRPYGTRGTARGEWPAQRFVCVEDKSHGLALINTGVPGVEVAGGVLWTTLLRAPYSEYAGMVRDKTSAQHGAHTFRFGLMPYEGSWVDAGVARAAQELNNPLVAFPLASDVPCASLVSLEPPAAVLSTIKRAEDDSGETIARIYETTGRPCVASLWVAGATAAWDSDLAERAGEPVRCDEGRLELPMRAFEIRTVRIARGL